LLGWSWTKRETIPKKERKKGGRKEERKIANCELVGIHTFVLAVIAIDLYSFYPGNKISFKELVPVIVVFSRTSHLKNRQ
jgi:hypothetical protein